VVDSELRLGVGKAVVHWSLATADSPGHSSRFAESSVLQAWMESSLELGALLGTAVPGRLLSAAALE
jgi:hypothetical protein